MPVVEVPVWFVVAVALLGVLVGALGTVVVVVFLEPQATVGKDKQA